MDLLKGIRAATASCKRLRKATLAAIISTILSDTLTILVITTNNWEQSSFYALETIPNLILNDSIIDDLNGFYSLKVASDKDHSTINITPIKTLSLSSSLTSLPSLLPSSLSSPPIKKFNILFNLSPTPTLPLTTPPLISHYIMRARSGGIWKICDRISDNLRSSSRLQNIIGKIPKFKKPCYKYVADYDKANMTEKAIAMIRMQNSAVSCVIVCILCMACSLCTGVVGVSKHLVAVCMITGVLVCVSGTFFCFSLTIMATKFKYMSNDCLSVDATLPQLVCQHFSTHLSWSMVLGWVALIGIVAKAVCWLYLSRCYRLEKSKSLV